ncbi:MAG: hypothetical protein VYA84_20715 [Planctomycetota bacterium]|nr:hypothetical protein [Planctomycetota bacterium]
MADRVPNMLGSYRTFASVLFAGLLLALSGCVALNIPSQRWHNPEDPGGLFGHHRGGSDHQTGVQELLLTKDSTVMEISEGPYEELPVSPGFFGESEFRGSGGCCAECETNCFDPLAETEAATPPDIPWPKFHPVPTRPVYGPHGVQ